MKKRLVLLTLSVPEGVSDAELRDYVDTAVERWRGGFAADDELFPRQGEKLVQRVTVTPTERRSKLNG